MGRRRSAGLAVAVALLASSATGARDTAGVVVEGIQVVRTEITRLNTELRLLAAALTGPEIPVAVTRPSRVLAGGRTLNGAV